MRKTITKKCEMCNNTFKYKSTTIRHTCSTPCSILYRTSDQRKAYQKQYNTSDKGKASHKKYRESAKGKSTKKIYEDSAKGKSTRKIYEDSAKRKSSKRRHYEKRNESK